MNSQQFPVNRATQQTSQPNLQQDATLCRLCQCCRRSNSTHPLNCATQTSRNPTCCRRCPLNRLQQLVDSMGLHEMPDFRAPYFYTARASGNTSKPWPINTPVQWTSLPDVRPVLVPRPGRRPRPEQQRGDQADNAKASTTTQTERQIKQPQNARASRNSGHATLNPRNTTRAAEETDKLVPTGQKRKETATRGMHCHQR